MKKIELLELYTAQKKRCFYCFGPMRFVRGQGPVDYTVDHFLAKCKGNKSNGNIVLAHAKCNLEKGHRDPTQAECIRKDNLYRIVKDFRQELRDFVGV